MTQVSSLYLHVPFCRHLCNYCDFYKRKYDPDSSQINDFHQFLEIGVERHKKLMSENGVRWSELETLYLGGGTPSLWGERGAEFFKGKILSGLTLKKNAEFTMEIDPGTWTKGLIESWQSIGLNRISIGTQTLDPHFLKIMDRDHTLEESHSLLKFCHENDWNFSLDFLLGLPFSKEQKRDIKKELDDLLQYKPKHISLYILNARSKYPHIQAIPDDEFIREEYLLVSEYLKNQGFHHYEVSNFSLPGFESLHNKKYWRSESVAAFGPTGTGYFSLGHDKALRYKWKVSEAEIEQESLGASEIDLEKNYLELRTSEGWKPKNPQKMGCLIKSWEQQGYGKWTGEKMKLSSLGFLMLDSLMDDIFRLEAKY